mmetsp:Transcript_1597/g.3591  ORF Transcript_1597/g.3591 Transcript_1597/m.3591 type:complete len:353 (-) Transcript_1597:1103-2161(-)
MIHVNVIPGVCECVTRQRAAGALPPHNPNPKPLGPPSAAVIPTSGGVLLVSGQLGPSCQHASHHLRPHVLVTIQELDEVLHKQSAQLLQGAGELLLTAPRGLGLQHLGRHAWALGRHLQPEDGGGAEGLSRQLLTVDGVHNGTSVLEADAGAHAVPPACPACVDEPGGGAVLLHLVTQHGRVLHGVPHEEGRPEARAEGGLRLLDALLSARHLGGVPGHKVVHGLLQAELADGGEYPKCIAAQQDHVPGVGPHAGDARVVDEVNGVAGPRVLRDGGRVKVNDAAPLVKHHVLKNGAKADGAEYFWLLGLLQVDALCVAAPLNVEHAVIPPAVLVITNEGAGGVGGQRGLAGA